MTPPPVDEAFDGALLMRRLPRRDGFGLGGTGETGVVSPEPPKPLLPAVGDVLTLIEKDTAEATASPPLLGLVVALPPLTCSPDPVPVDEGVNPPTCGGERYSSCECFGYYLHPQQSGRL